MGGATALQDNDALQNKRNISADPLRNLLASTCASPPLPAADLLFPRQLGFHALHDPVADGAVQGVARHPAYMHAIMLDDEAPDGGRLACRVHYCVCTCACGRSREQLT